MRYPFFGRRTTAAGAIQPADSVDSSSISSSSGSSSIASGRAIRSSRRKASNNNGDDDEENRGIFGNEDMSPVAVSGHPDEESSAVEDGGEGGGATRKASASATGGSDGDGDGEEKLESTTKEPTPVATFEVEGMTCAVCVGIVENLVRRVPGVNSAEVSLALERATVAYSPELVNPEQLVEAIEAGGYEAKLCVIEEEAEDDEMANTMEKKSAKMRAAIRRARNIFLVSLIFSVPVVVVSMGFDDNSGGTVGTFLNRRIVPGLAVRTVIEWVLATPVQFGCGARFYRGTYHDLRNRALGMNFLVASGTSAAYLYSVVLVLLAISTKEEDQPMLFFETSAVLVSFILLGKYLELLARGRASNAVGKLMDLRADRAVLVSDWPACELKGEIDMDASDLAVGDVVKVVRGSKIPADGVVLRGNAAVNESMVTGESMPVHKDEESDVIGATVCSEGLVYVKVTRTGKASALHQIIRLVEQAQGSKAPIEEFGDRVAAVFVPSVACVALLTLIVWLTLTLSGAVPERWYRDLSGSPGPGLFSFLFALAVMVIACPCAVGLAAPTALLVGTGMSARHGVLIKGGAALQRVSELKRVVFDKTGTLTVGKPRVTEVAYVESESLQKALLSGTNPKSEGKILNVPGEVLRLVASAERSSEHPLAKAIVEFHSVAWAKGQRDAAEAGTDATRAAGSSKELEMPAEGSTQAVSGRGLSCTVAGLEVSVGSPSYIEKVLGKPLTALPELIAGSLESSGRTVVVAAIEGQLAALFGLVDTLRPEAKEVISELERMGLEVWMLTGDNRRAAHEVARRAGLPADRVCAEVLPGDKASKVEELQKDGKAVAMVGDGINDAPALATADVGIAVGGGTDVAVESADVVLMGSSLWDVLTSLDLSKTIVNRVRMNYVWALLYNTIGIPVAAGVFFPVLKATLPPELAGGAMAFSSVSVLLSSLALRLYRPPLAARKATRAAAESAAKERFSSAEGPESEFDPETIWTIDLTCDYPCCRHVAAVQLGTNSDIADKTEASTGGISKVETLENDDNSNMYQFSVGLCCGSDSANAVVASDHISSGKEDKVIMKKKQEKKGDDASCFDGDIIPRVRCGDPELGGDKGCSCTCSFCRCVRAIEP